MATTATPLTRYDLMSASPTEVDSTDNQPWPDPLTVDYSKFTYSIPPTIFAVDDTFLTLPYLTCYGIYQIATYDDLVLGINNIPHISLLPLNTQIKFPDASDIIAFSKKR
jgi:hypothetical protein